MEVTATEMQRGLRDLEVKVRIWKPRAVAFLGKPAWTAYAKTAKLPWGLQTESFGGAEVWVLPNPSGLNRSFSLADLVVAYRELRRHREAV